MVPEVNARITSFEYLTEDSGLVQFTLMQLGIERIGNTGRIGVASRPTYVKIALCSKSVYRLCTKDTAFSCALQEIRPRADRHSGARWNCIRSWDALNELEDIRHVIFLTESDDLLIGY